MSKFVEALETYKKDMVEKMNISTVNEELLTAVAKSLGPSIYLADASLVSGSDKAELDRVKKNFLIKKLGLTESDDLDGAITAVIDKVGKSNRNKHRAVFYYFLVEHFGKQDVFK